MASKGQNNVVLIFSPHPDDAEISMGGTICHLLDKGWDVVVADLTNGEPTPMGSEEIRAAETRKATEVLGLTDRLCLNLPNRYLEETLEARRLLAETIRRYKPRWLFTVYRPDAHPDHIHAGRLVEDARFTAKLTKTDMAGEPHYPEKLIYFYASHLNVHPQPSFVVDISPYWDKKVEAIKAYQSQFFNNVTRPAGWIMDRVTTSCKYFGHRIGVEYGEPFFSHNLTGFTDLTALK